MRSQRILTKKVGIFVFWLWNSFFFVFLLYKGSSLHNVFYSIEKKYILRTRKFLKIFFEFSKNSYINRFTKIQDGRASKSDTMPYPTLFLNLLLNQM